MDLLKIQNLFTYPIKSTKGNKNSKILVTKNGFINDRNFAIIDKYNKIITAREKPELLKIEALVKKSELTIHLSTNSSTVDFSCFSKKSIKVSLFNEITKAKTIDNRINNLLSKYLNEECRLIKFLATENEINNKAFNDIAPIHLITTASLDDLNQKLKNPLTIHNFRPNIVISGCKAYEEETWKSIKIGTCEFEIISKTERCSMTTIDPYTLQKNKHQEPLRTLASYKKEDKSVNFGIYLTPTTIGTINYSDKIKIAK